MVVQKSIQRSLFLDFLVVQNFSILFLIGRVSVEFVSKGNVLSFVLSFLGPCRMI